VWGKFVVGFGGFSLCLCGKDWFGIVGVSVCCVSDSLLWVCGSEFVLCL